MSPDRGPMALAKEGDDDHLLHGVGTRIVEDCVDHSAASFQRRVLLPLAFANASDAVEILSVGFIMTEYRSKEGAGATPYEKQLLTSSVFFGMLVGGISCGFLADRLGRQPCLLGCLVVTAFFGALSAAAPTVGWLVAARVAAGLGVGGSIPSVFTLGTELFPTRIRGALLTLVASFWMFGAIYAAAVAWILLGNGANGDKIVPGANWRYYALAAAAPAILAALMTAVWVPESPRYLLAAGKLHEAAAVLNRMTANSSSGGAAISPEDLASGSSHAVWMAGEDGGSGYSFVGSEGSDVGSPPHAKCLSGGAPARGNVWRGLFVGPGAARTTVVLMVVWFTLSYGSYGVSVWNNELFRDAGLGDAYLDSFIFALANLPGNVVSVVLIERVGRKALLAASMALAAAAATLFAFAGYGGAALVVIAASLFTALGSSGWNCLDCLSAECFPTPSRSSGMGLVAACGRAGAIAAEFANGSLESRSVAVLLLVTSGVMLAGAGASLLLPKDTKGRQLAQA